MTPLHKNGPKDDTNNYRPISVLPVVSKLLEKHVHDSLMMYLSSNSLLHSTQSGFRPNHSCETSLLQMINRWLNAINSSQMIGMVMIDFRKAFDLVDHTLLLKKLKYYKISEATISWFSSYLLGRKQKVFVNNSSSESENIICGVPQGSILGPLLFLIFINDLPLYIDNVLTDLYADDTTFYFIDTSQACIEQQLQTALFKLSEWCKENGMLINTTKTKVMLITTVSGQNPPRTESPPLFFVDEDRIPPVYLANRTESPPPPTHTSQTESTSIIERYYLVDYNKWRLKKIKYDNLVIFNTFYSNLGNYSIIEVCLTSLVLLAVIMTY